MDIEVLNDARTDLAKRMAQLDTAALNYATNSRAEGWLIELSRMEQQHGYTVIEATLEYYIEKASDPRSVPGLGIAIEFYLESLWEWQSSIHRKSA